MMMETRVRRGKSLYVAYDLHNKLVDPKSAEDCIADDSLVWYAEAGTSPFDITVGYATAREVPGVCLFLNSAGVRYHWRGQGLHKRLIKVRTKYAKRNGLVAITYTSPDNIVSANNLISCGFKLYTPANEWVGPNFLYWRLEP